MITKFLPEDRNTQICLLVVLIIILIAILVHFKSVRSLRLSTEKALNQLQAEITPIETKDITVTKPSKNEEEAATDKEKV